MRHIFFEKFKKKMDENESLFFLTGDTGFNLVEPILQKYPNRSMNVGVAEQNLIGIASGLASMGFIPVCYAITNFLVERCFEQIRNDICLHKYKILLIGTSTGYDNGALGPTHHKLDDIGAAKVFPNISIYSPSGQKSISLILDEALESDHASFIRISKADFLEECDVLSPNHFISTNQSNLLLITHGKMLSKAFNVYKSYPNFSLFAMDRIKSLDDKLLSELFDKYSKVVVLEDNFKSGLFNSLCQWSCENHYNKNKIFSISPDEKYDEIVGTAEYLEDLNGISEEKIKNKLEQIQKI